MVQSVCVSYIDLVDIKETKLYEFIFIKIGTNVYNAELGTNVHNALKMNSFTLKVKGGQGHHRQIWT